MIDTHCHIDDPQYAEGLDAFLAEQRQDGVEYILVPGVDKTSVKDVLEVCDRYPDYLFPALGLHPENVKEDWREQLATIKAAVDARMHQLPTANCQLSTVNCQLESHCHRRNRPRLPLGYGLQGATARSLTRADAMGRTIQSACNDS